MFSEDTDSVKYSYGEKLHLGQQRMNARILSYFRYSQWDILGILHSLFAVWLILNYRTSCLGWLIFMKTYMIGLNPIEAEHGFSKRNGKLKTAAE